MDDIQIYENFLTEDEMEHVTNVIKSPRWSLDQTSDPRYPGIPFWLMRLLDDSFFTEHLFPKIEHKLGRNFELLDVYLNGQTYGQDADFHIDTAEDECFTFLVYIGDITKESVNVYGGYTIFKSGDLVKCVEPIKNRAVLFNSAILHVGLSPSRRCKEFRISLAFKLREIK